jgi:hypothetical protein
VAVQSEVVTETGDSMTAIAFLRVNLAVQHMLAAARFSRDVGELERDHENQPFGEFWESIFHSAIACVLTTVASLEAYANELFSDRITVFPKYSHELLHNLWDTYERKPMLDKFDFALLLLRKPKLVRGVRPYQDIKILVDLRDALIHFKPEWEHEAVEHKKLSKALHSKTKGSPLFPKSELLFPRRWASHSCTMWVVRSAVDFSKKFEQRAGLPAKYPHSILNRGNL